MVTFFGWPIRLVPINANTGQPLDPAKKRFITEVGRDSLGRPAMIRRNGSGSRGPVFEIKGQGGGGNGASKTNGDNKGGKGDEKKSSKGNNKNESGKKDEAKKEQGGGDKKDEDFTTEEDEKLKAMKAENKTWKEIASEMERPVHQLKGRFKELNREEGGGSGDQKKSNENKNAKKGGKKDAGKENNEAKKNSNAEKQNKKKDEEKKKADKAQSVRSEADPRFTMGEWMELQEDDFFSFGELHCLSELLMEDDRHRWLRIASRFYDKTGRRIHPDDIRDKFEGLERLRGDLGEEMRCNCRQTH